MLFYTRSPKVNSAYIPNVVMLILVTNLKTAVSTSYSLLLTGTTRLTPYTVTWIQVVEFPAKGTNATLVNGSFLRHSTYEKKRKFYYYPVILKSTRRTEFTRDGLELAFSVSSEPLLNQLRDLSSLTPGKMNNIN